MVWAWYSNPVRQDVRRRWLHWAMAAPLSCSLLALIIWMGKRPDIALPSSRYVLRSSSMMDLFFLKNWAIPSLFFFFSYCQYSWQKTNVLYKSLPMTGFKPLTSGLRSNRSTNWATTPPPDWFVGPVKIFNLILIYDSNICWYWSWVRLGTSHFRAQKIEAKMILACKRAHDNRTNL